LRGDRRVFVLENNKVLLREGTNYSVGAEPTTKTLLAYPRRRRGKMSILILKESDWRRKKRLEKR
jgi:hypothetical protein